MLKILTCTSIIHGFGLKEPCRIDFGQLEGNRSTLCWDIRHFTYFRFKLLNILTLDPCRYINMAYICFVSYLEVFPRVKLWIPHIRLAKSLLDPSDPGNPDPTGFSGSRTWIKPKSTSAPQWPVLSRLVKLQGFSKKTEGLVGMGRKV